MNQFFYTANVKAGVPYMAPFGGKYFAIWDSGVNRSVDVQLSFQGQNYNNMPAMTAGFQCEGDFDKVFFNCAVDTVVQFFASQKPLKIGNKDGLPVSIPSGVVITNTVGQAIPVNFTGTVSPVLGNVTVNNSSAQSIPVNTYKAQTVTERAPVSVTATASALVVTSTVRRGFRAKNVGANAVAIGGSTVVFANATIVIQPGETWNEADAPGAAWYCICDTGLTSTINLQDIS